MSDSWSMWDAAEHADEAERLCDKAMESSPEFADQFLKMAQVHGLLAVAKSMPAARTVRLS